MVTVKHRGVDGCVSGASAALAHEPFGRERTRRCCRPGRPRYAVALTFLYSGSAVIGHLPLPGAPFTWICVSAAGRITARARVGNSCVTRAAASHPDGDDLWWPWRTRCARVAKRSRHHPGDGFDDFPATGAPTGSGVPPEAAKGAGAKTSTGVARPRRLSSPCCSRPIRPASFARPDRLAESENLG